MTFDAIAPHYDRLERWFSRGLMHRARTMHLLFITQCRHALLLGEGPGRFLPLVLQQFPDAVVTCVDSSARMLALSRRKISEAEQSRVTFLETDIHSWQPDASQFDLIATNFFLDCFDEHDLAQIVPSIASAATEDAQWLIADFNVPKSGFIRWRASLIVGVIYRFFGFATGLSTRRLISPHPWLKRSGFQLHRRIEFDLGLLHSDWWTRRPGSK
jgi:ubiquinone/menaquinone biosynthesis C-methylase UbiE